MPEKMINERPVKLETIVDNLRKQAFFLHFFGKKDLTEAEKWELQWAKHYIEEILS